ncbi:unnamed protein product [Moneuplotes crassus]|uniref:Uncharacterized protein n=1 Tax=Euplotes crassus TaxID=5936 RepID=A0AAD1U284_EUPCR|nr:unnamed protein product [Moneuplotes crassus]
MDPVILKTSIYPQPYYLAGSTSNKEARKGGINISFGNRSQAVRKKQRDKKNSFGMEKVVVLEPARRDDRVFYGRKYNLSTGRFRKPKVFRDYEYVDKSLDQTQPIVHLNVINQKHRLPKRIRQAEGRAKSKNFSYNGTQFTIIAKPHHISPKRSKRSTSPTQKVRNNNSPKRKTKKHYFDYNSQNTRGKTVKATSQSAFRNPRKHASVLHRTNSFEKKKKWPKTTTQDRSKEKTTKQPKQPKQQHQSKQPQKQTHPTEEIVNISTEVENPNMEANPPNSGEPQPSDLEKLGNKFLEAINFFNMEHRTKLDESSARKVVTKVIQQAFQLKHPNPHLANSIFTPKPTGPSRPPKTSAYKEDALYSQRKAPFESKMTFGHPSRRSVQEEKEENVEAVVVEEESVKESEEFEEDTKFDQEVDQKKAGWEESISFSKMNSEQSPTEVLGSEQLNGDYQLNDSLTANERHLLSFMNRFPNNDHKAAAEYCNNIFSVEQRRMTEQGVLSKINSLKQRSLQREKSRRLNTDISVFAPDKRSHNPEETKFSTNHHLRDADMRKTGTFHAHNLKSNNQLEIPQENYKRINTDSNRDLSNNFKFQPEINEHFQREQDEEKSNKHTEDNKYSKKSSNLEKIPEESEQLFSVVPSEFD